jgi:6,7-dimethyl-8-ribityllumazine synthase
MTTSSVKAPDSDSRVLIVASRFNEVVTRRLLEGAQATLEAAGFGADRQDVFWVPGAFEIPVVVHSGLATGRYACAVALGAVIRGETPHNEYIATEAARGIADAAIRHSKPVGFGVLTCDTMEQALARSGGAAGNKGVDAAHAAIETVQALLSLGGSAQD